MKQTFVMIDHKIQRKYFQWYSVFNKLF